MRRAMSAVLMVGVLVLLPPYGAAATEESPRVIQFWYNWGDAEILGSQVWTSAHTNLTMDVLVSEENGSRVEEITEFRFGAFAPGQDPYPASNGTNPHPHALFVAAYDTTQVIRDPDNCVPSNNSVGFECDVPRASWRHQVLELRFLRLFEFVDSNGDSGYDAGENIVSETDLVSPSVAYAAVAVDGLNATTGAAMLPFRVQTPNTCCGESWEGWFGQADEEFRSYDGLRLRISAGGPPFLNLTTYQWFEPRSFHGVNVTPFHVKLDIEVDGYAFASASSRLGLELNVTAFSQGSATNWEVVPWPEGRGIGANTANTTAVFLWSSTATADGETVTVGGSVVPRDEFSRSVYLSYPQASEINHDPVLGIQDLRLGTRDGMAPVEFVLSLVWVAFVGTLVAGTAAVYVVERRKQKG